MAEKGTPFGKILGEFKKQQYEKFGYINNATKGKKGFFSKAIGVVAGRLSKDKPVNNQQGNTLG